MRDRLLVLLRREALVSLSTYIFCLIPFTVFLAYLGILLDRRLGIPPFLLEPLNYVLFAFFTLPGLLLVWWSYSYLILEGEGDATGLTKNCRRVVTEGPYSFIRHPSVPGKLLGVIGLGCLMRSFSFTFIFVPLLLCWSIFYNSSIQERHCIKFYGDEYVRYMSRVPMLIPRKERIMQAWRDLLAAIGTRRRSL